MDKIAACFIVESDKRAKEFEKALESIKPHVDEIFVTTNNRPDKKIRELCKKYDCRHSFLAWDRNFAEQRNFNFDQAVKAGYEYIFWMDSDDTIEGGENLRKLVESWPKGLDMILVEYDYANDGIYKVAGHKRERLIKYSPERMKWVGRIHEQIICNNGAGQSLVTDDFKVVHHSKNSDSLEDSVETARRNIDILLLELKEQGDNPDPRTLIQLGRAYTGTEEFHLAVPYLERYIPLSGWDEERYEAICLLGQCMIGMDKEDLAEKFYYRAIMEMHNRYQAYEGIIRIYYNRENWEKVAFWFETMARVPQPRTTHLTMDMSVKMRTKGMYVHALFGMNQYEKAIQIWGEILEDYEDHPDIKSEHPKIMEVFYTQMALDSTKKLINYMSRYKRRNIAGVIEALPDDLQHNPEIIEARNALVPPKVHADNEVTIFCGGIGLEEWAYPSIFTGIGGSEEAVVNVAEQLTKLGYKVTVYNNCGSLMGEYGGVKYLPYYEVNQADRFNIFISWRDPNPLGMVTAKKKWLWLHDVPVPEHYDKETVSNIDKIIVLSQYHRSLLPDVVDEKFLISRNGVGMSNFNGEVVKNPNKIIYTSSPERGLDNFLAIAAEVKKEMPHVEFEAYYGWQNNDAVRSGDPEYEEWKEETNRKIEELGMPAYTRLSHKEIATKMMESGIWLYPTTFPEISCIAAMKAQVAGAWPICTDHAALAETVKFGNKIKSKFKDNEPMDEQTIQKFVSLVKERLTAEDLKRIEDDRFVMMDWARENYDWKGVAEQWDKEWKNEGNSSNTSL